MRSVSWIFALAVPASFLTLGSNKPETFADIRDHFKYGSIGAEARAGVPYWVWAALPRLFPERLPKRPGDGYARFGLIFESEKAGTSHRHELPRACGPDWSA